MSDTPPGGPSDTEQAVDDAMNTLIDNIGDDKDVEYATRVLRQELFRLQGLLDAAGVEWRE